jgi:hypothetical protein
MANTKTPQVRRWLQRVQAQIASGFDRVLLYEFDLLEEHRAFTERHFADSAKRFEERYQADLAAVSEADRDDYTEHMIDEYTNMVESFPRLQWYAQFLVVYSTFEHSLNELCRIVRNDQGLNWRLLTLEIWELPALPLICEKLPELKLRSKQPNGIAPYSSEKSETPSHIATVRLMSTQTIERAWRPASKTFLGYS